MAQGTEHAAEHYHHRHANKSALVQQPVQEYATRRGIEAVQNAPIRSAEHHFELLQLVNEYLHRVGNPPLRKGRGDHEDGHLGRGSAVDRSVGTRRVPADLLARAVLPYVTPWP